MSAYSHGDILAYLQGHFGPDQVSAFEQALDASADLRREVAACRSILETMQTDDTEAPGQAAIEAALAAVVPQPAPQTSWWDLLDQVVAAITFDSRLQGAAPGFRGAATGYQVSYEATNIDVDIEVRASGVILGNVSAKPQPMEVVLLAADNSRAITHARPDPRGNFRLEAEPGEYRIGICLEDQAVMLAGIRIP